MYPFDWTEIILYLLPLIILISVNKYGKKYLNDDHSIKLAVVDVMHPILWVCVHFVSLYTFNFSFIPILATLLCALAIILLSLQFKKGRPFFYRQFLRRLSNVTFIYVFISYYFIIIFRIYFVVVGFPA